LFSNCGSKAVSVFCFGPVTEEGLGLGYVLHKVRVEFEVEFVFEVEVEFELLLFELFINTDLICVDCVFEVEANLNCCYLYGCCLNGIINADLLHLSCV
jgi:hypothetical protein